MAHTRELYVFYCVIAKAATITYKHYFSKSRKLLPNILNICHVLFYRVYATNKGRWKCTVCIGKRYPQVQNKYHSIGTQRK